MRAALADWRGWALFGATAGVAVSPLAGRPGSGALAVALGALAAAALLRPRGSGDHGAWRAMVCLACASAGLALGAARLDAIDAGAFRGAPGRHAQVTGWVAAVAHRSGGVVRVPLSTADGRLMVEAPASTADLPVGAEVSARGIVREPPDWYAPYLRRLGIARVLAVSRIQPTGGHRGGVAGAVDAIRDRAAAALERGMPDAEADLARGMVLGEDDRIDAATRTDFKQSGLAHHLAVSGENVLLLALLATPLLALAGLSRRARLLGVLALVAIYVPVTGAGPSIQRAGAMGAAGIVAALSGRPRSRWYALALAAIATLSLNPRSSGDVGWQLSFAAVAGIFLWSGPLRAILLGGAPRPSAAGRALCEGAAMTGAATVATAPLFAHHFGQVSVASLAANLLALPAIAPLMWLGMLAAVAGQVPALPVESLNAMNSLLLAYVAQVAHWLGSPRWAQAGVRLDGTAAVLAAYVAIGLAMTVSLRALARRPRRVRGLRGRRLAVALAVFSCGLAAAPLVATPTSGRAAPRGLEVDVLDVGQGDAILLRPERGEPILVDGGPPGDELAANLRDAGVDRLGAAVVTHDQSDHTGGVAELLGDLPVRRLVYAEAGGRLLRLAAAAGARPTRVAEGTDLRSGRLDVEVLWPPRELLDGPADDPNARALVLLARWRGFSILLTADAEAEAVPIDPGPVDVLKLAHHGSDDAGLDALLDRTAPRLAVISVGAGNPYGHPTPATLATLSAHGIPVLRTDQAGTIEIEADRQGWRILRP